MGTKRGLVTSDKSTQERFGVDLHGRSAADIKNNRKYFVSEQRGEYLIALETIKQVDVPFYTAEGEQANGYTIEEGRLVERVMPDFMKDAKPGEVWQIEYCHNAYWGEMVSAKCIGLKDDLETKKRVRKFNEIPELVY